MKASYTLKKDVDIKEIKVALKDYGGKRAKVLDDKLEYQIKEEQEQEVFSALNKKGYI